MTEEQIALARRAVACRGWKWMPGMRVMSDPKQVPRVIGSPVWSSDLSARVTTVVLGRWHGVGEYCVDHPDAEHESMSGDDLPGTLPNLTDAATLGCVLALVREAWGDECACVLPIDYGPGGVMWVCQLTAGGRSLTARHWSTEAESLVAALEAAP